MEKQFNWLKNNVTEIQKAMSWIVANIEEKKNQQRRKLEIPCEMKEYREWDLTLKSSKEREQLVCYAESFF